MPRAELRGLLVQLREALADRSTMDADARALLVQVRDDIEESLELSSEARRRRYPGTVERLGDAIEAFQTSRPGLTRSMNHLLEVLAGMGF